jgi:hypothetical protein
MTGHEWINWAIKATQEGKLVWDKTLEHDDTHGDYYRGTYQTSTVGNMVYIFCPRPDKKGVAEIRRYWDIDPTSLEGNTPRWRVDYINRVVVTKNFVPGFGYLCNKISNSKAYKLEKYIVGVKPARITYSSPSKAGRKEMYKTIDGPATYSFDDVFNIMGDESSGE